MHRVGYEVRDIGKSKGRKPWIPGYEVQIFSLRKHFLNFKNEHEFKMGQMFLRNNTEKKDFEKSTYSIKDIIK